jgi:hypothetical protein
MRNITRFSFLMATVVCAPAAAAQDTTAVCRSNACAVEFDWGSGQSAASVVADRRYGSGQDFETGFRARMGDKGFRISTDPAGAALKVSLRIAMTSAMCDITRGTNPDRRCRAMRDVAVTFTPIDTTVKRIGSQRITNRCGDRDQLMTMTQFGQYVADMIHYTIEGEKAKAQRPALNC